MYCIYFLVCRLQIMGVNTNDRTHRTFGLSVEDKLFLVIEKNRGNVNRSKYITTILECCLMNRRTSGFESCFRKKIPVEPKSANFDQQVFGT